MLHSVIFRRCKDERECPIANSRVAESQTSYPKGSAAPFVQRRGQCLAHELRYFTSFLIFILSFFGVVAGSSCQNQTNPTTVRTEPEKNLCRNRLSESDRLKCYYELWVSRKQTKYRYQVKVECASCYLNTSHNYKSQDKGKKIESSFDKWITIVVDKDDITIFDQQGLHFDDYKNRLSVYHSSPDLIETGFKLIRDAVDNKASTLSVKYNEENGYPEKIVIDGSKNTFDDEVAIHIERFELLN